MFCGFNEKMLETLSGFNKELITYGLVQKSKENDETTEQAIQREISDMSRFLQETHRIQDASKRMMTEGLLKYCIGFYMNMRRNKVEDHEDIVKRLGEFFMFMDNHYYSDLCHLPDDMEKLASALNQKNI
ncbi:MAG: hypothetical protein JWM20_311 [Patescibacteria group bacterium]|nr:hypothetical protein [Patescibacteria group bacterium]